MKLLNVHCFPRHLSLAFVAVFVKYTGIETFLRVATRRIQSEAFVHVDRLVDAQVVSRGDKYCPWFERGVG